MNARRQLAARPAASSGASIWTPLGPWAVTSPSYGLVTGRVSSLALDPSDTSGNTLYVGTTGGGVWVAQNAATSNAGGIAFTPLTDAVSALSGGAVDPSISIGALTVQPGGTGVILAGTGDPNDALDSYYGAGILRSTNGGNTWTLIPQTSDLQAGIGLRNYSFQGEGFAGFAWSTVNPQLVVAAVSQAFEGQLVDAEIGGVSYKGLYYSTDAGASWHLARITDGSADVQGPLDGYSLGDGSAATAVVWNPVRGIFVAAVRFHGYYQSADGITWTRMASQPGSELTAAMCPTNSLMAGSPACPIFRGVLAVNPLTGDTFAWTVDLNNQDQGLWQDACAASGGKCPGDITFSKQWSTTAIDLPGTTTVANGDYNLALAAVPSSQDTLLMAGGNDLWSCSLAMGCTWRNTTNAFSCMSAQVGPYQHAIEWSTANPLEMFVGNDSGLWRSLDAIGESGSACSASDASHWQNLNGGIGSLAEVESMSPVGATPYTMMAGLGANGTAGANNTTAVARDWPQILSGEGGPVVIDPSNPDNWYVNNDAGVSIHSCAKGGACTPADFGNAPVVSDADVANDGLVMTAPAPFLVDPVDASQLLIGTCRLWRGPASGSGWPKSAVVTMLDGDQSNPACHGNALIRSMAAARLPSGGEVVYVGVYGGLPGGPGGTVGGHVFRATMDASGNWSGWQDLTAPNPKQNHGGNPPGNPVDNDLYLMNFLGLDVSSITIDPHDSTANTVYVTIAGIQNPRQPIAVIYRSYPSADGTLHWLVIDDNLPWAPANSVAVDPADPNTVYVATDAGVFSTRSVTTCGAYGGNCWAPYGAGLPMAPVVALSSSTVDVSPGVLVAGTYGRGLWQIPLITSSAPPTTVTVSPASITFGAQTVGTQSTAPPITLTNTGSAPLMLEQIVPSGDFSETDNCSTAPVVAGASCSIAVTFLPTQAGSRTGQLTISGNLQGGSIEVGLSGTGVSTGSIALSPVLVAFGSWQVGNSSAPQSITVANEGGTDVPVTSINVTPPFVLTTNSCGTVVAANHDCVLILEFQPSTSGPATGTLTVVDSDGTQYAQLTGTGTSPPTDTLSVSSLSFPATIIGQDSASQTVTITNSGMNPLTSIQVSTAGPFLQSNNCGTQIAAASKCPISVQFLPTAQGVQTGTLTISDILTTQRVSLSGTGLQPPAFSVSPPSLTFATQQVGVASGPLTLTVTNSGGAAMANVGFQISGQAATSFSTGVTTCGAILDTRANCTIQLIFTPAAAGAATATLTIASSTQGVKAIQVSLNGAGQAPSALTANPAQLTFAPTAIGQTSAPQSVTIANPGATTAAGLTLSVSGPFSLAQSTCQSTLAAGATCTAGIAFTPMQNGSLTGTLTINSTSVSAATTVALRGTGGLTGGIQMQPAQVNFPATGVGARSSPISVTISNSSATVSLDSLALTASTGFSLSGNTCGTSLAAGASCTANVVFAPTTTGAQTGTLTIASSALGANATVPLSGTGFDFTAVASGAGSQTVASGQTGNYSVTLTPSGGVPEALTFQCNSLPTYAACLFNPSTNNVAANATGTETVQITTSQATGMAAPMPLSPGQVEKTAVLACGLLLLPLVARKRRKLLALLALVALALGGFSSCSSSGGGSGGTPPSTPASHNVAPGTYTVSLVVSSGPVQHTVTLTLVVD